MLTAPDGAGLSGGRTEPWASPLECWKLPATFESAHFATSFYASVDNRAR